VDFATHADLTGRLRGLVILLAERLTPDQARAADDLIDASLFSSALESLVDGLSEHKIPIPDDVRGDFARLASQLGDDVRVMDALDCCPRETCA
jgi:hypothetical protein